MLNFRQINDLISENQQSNDRSMRSSQDMIQNLGSPLKSDNSKISPKDGEVSMVSPENNSELRKIGYNFVTSPDDQINQSSDKKFNGKIGLFS